jgi:hypothetical protein
MIAACPENSPVEMPANPLDRYVDEYLRKHAQKSQRTKLAYESFQEKDAIRSAASLQVLRVSGQGWKRHDHFCQHTPGKFLEAAHSLVAGKTRLRKSSALGFEALLAEVSDLLKSVRGLSFLAFYDITELLGYHYKCYPEFVYLHAGTLVGGNALLQRQETQGQKLSVAEFPYALRLLTAAQLEDFLCVFAKCIKAFDTTDWIRIERDWRGT